MSTNGTQHFTTSSRHGRLPKQPGEVRTMIMWKEAEWGTVVNRVRELRRNDPKLNQENAIRQAMTALPAPRQRKFGSTLSTGITKRIKALVAYEQKQAERAAAKAARVEATPPEVQVPEAPVQPAPQPALFDEEEATPPGEMFVHELTIAVAAIFAGALAQPVFRESIKGLLRDIMGAPAAPDSLDFRWPEPVVIAGVEKPRLPRVLVAGVIGPQAQTLAQRFGKQVDLRFWSVDKSPDQLRVLSDKADVTIGFVNFIGHSHENIMKSRAKRYLRCAGGMTRLVEMIEQLPAS